jgi:hypothetical protein
MCEGLGSPRDRVGAAIFGKRMLEKELVIGDMQIWRLVQDGLE